jgi:ATPase FliI/YscN family
MASKSALDILSLEPFPETGRVTAIRAGAIEADGPDCPVGARCLIESRDKGRPPLPARVAAVGDGKVILAPFASPDGLQLVDRVSVVQANSGALAGNGFAGRAVNGLAMPIDGGPTITGEARRGRPLATLDRLSPSKPFLSGVRAIDGLLTLGHGQRVGIFAASGVGKTRLVEQIIRQHNCQRAVICLVGERGREVEALWRNLSAPETRARTTLVAATADEMASMRIQAVEQALALAEHWRDAGEDVLLVVDSITRYAMALREIGLMSGEPPTVRAYTPNIFRELPSVVERCGADRNGGTITAIFTVLSESDDVDDPLVEVMKSLLDGHILLSRRLAQAGQFPAIDIGRSISRLFDALVDPEQSAAAVHCRSLLARYEESRILIESGMYRAGSDRELDEAIDARPAVLAYVQQASDERTDAREARAGLMALMQKACR